VKLGGIPAAILAVVFGCWSPGGHLVVRAAQDADDAEYVGAIQQYIRGYPVDAVAIVKRFDQGRLKNNVSRLTARRRDVGRINVLGAGLLHLEIALSERNIPGRYAFELNLGLARDLLRAADGMERAARASQDTTELRALHVVGLFLLDEVSGRDARFYIEQWLGQFPNDPALLIAAGTACESQGTGRWDALTEHGLQTVVATERRYMGDALRYFDAALARQPQAVEALVHKATVLRVLHDDASAERVTRAALDAHPTPEWRYLALLTLGELRSNAGDRDAAMNAIREAVRLFPSAQSGALALAALQDANHELDVATNTVRQAIQRPLTTNTADPWWDYRLAHAKAAIDMLNELRTELHH
jgi:tetratricopeptide (TPR) repeat protein